MYVCMYDQKAVPEFHMHVRACPPSMRMRYVQQVIMLLAYETMCVSLTGRL